MANKAIKFIKNHRKNQPTMFWLTALSFFIAVVPFLYCLITFFPPNKLYGIWVFFIPFLVVFFISFLSYFVHKKFPLISNLILIPIIVFIVFIYQCFCGLIVFSWLYCANEEYKFDKPQYYEEVIEHFDKEKTAHFPKTIPENAKNIEMGGSYLSFFGSEYFFLKFDVDKKYVDSELKKYEFKGKENSEHYVFGALAVKDKFDIEKFTFYVINGELSRWGNNYGIAVNRDKTQIIYYYSNPD